MKTLTGPARARRACALAATASLWLLATPALHAHGDEGRDPGGWEVQTSAFHVHLVPVADGFQIHVHDAKTHRAVELKKARVTARVLRGGKATEEPLTVAAAGVMVGKRRLDGEWTLLVSINVPGVQPAQARFSSKTKPAEHHDSHSH